MRWWLYARCSTAVVAAAIAVSCAQRHSNGDDWVNELAAHPGSSLPRRDAAQAQVITLLSVSQQRNVGTRFFIAGVGYVRFDGGGTTLAGANRALDPFIELTIADNDDRMLPACQALLVPASFVNNAVQISGSGHFAALPGVQRRNLAVLLLENISDCRLVDRR
jgi:hypothetical protein